jgi:CheY-like chemotaxis protein
MEFPAEILVVSTVPAQLRLLRDWLAEERHQVVLARDFAEAREQLKSDRFDLLVADVKLGAYNGLQLVIWSRASRLDTKALLIGDADPVLRREADRERAGYLSPPFQPHAFLLAVNAQLSSCGPARRSPRKRVELPALVNGVPAEIVDLSQDGLCLVLRDQGLLAAPAVMALRVPAFDFACRVRRVWASRSRVPNGALMCGVALSWEDDGAVSAWKALVDAVPGRSFLSTLTV